MYCNGSIFNETDFRVNDTGHLQIIESLISRIMYLPLFESITPVTYSKSSKFLPIQIDISERPFQVVFLYEGSIRCSGGRQKYLDFRCLL